MGETHPGPYRFYVLQPYSLAGFRCFRKHQPGGTFFQNAAAGTDGCHNNTEYRCDSRRKGIHRKKRCFYHREAVHHAVSIPQNCGKQYLTDQDTGHTAEDSRCSRIKQIFQKNRAFGISQRFHRTDLYPFFLHHTGHGGQRHQCSYQEKEDGKYFCQRCYFIGVAINADVRRIRISFQDIPLTGFKLIDLFPGILNLLLCLGVGLIRLFPAVDIFCLSILVFF